jgi:CysZ protein
MWNILGGFGLLAGATYPFRALVIFGRTPRLWGYVVVPILLNFVLAIALYAGLLIPSWQGLESLTVSLMNRLDIWIANLPQWLSFLDYLVIGVGWLVRLLLVVGLLLLTGVLLVQFGVLLGSPWYGKLSEQLETLRTGQLQVIEVGIVRDIWRAIVFELKKLVLAVGVGIFLFLLNFAPGVGTLVATVGGIILAATLVCLDFFDAPLERRRLRFRDKLRLAFGSFPASGSFSLVCLVLVGVPFLNLLTIPLCVASGTLFFCDRIRPRLSQLVPSHAQLPADGRQGKPEQQRK